MVAVSLQLVERLEDASGSNRGSSESVTVEGEQWHRATNFRRWQIVFGRRSNKHIALSGRRGGLDGRVSFVRTNGEWGTRLHPYGWLPRTVSVEKPVW